METSLPRVHTEPSTACPGPRETHMRVWGVCPAPERLTWEFGVSAQLRRGSHGGLGCLPSPREAHMGVWGPCPPPTLQLLCPTSLRLQGDPQQQQQQVLTWELMAYFR